MEDLKRVTGTTDVCYAVVMKNKRSPGESFHRVFTLSIDLV